MQQAIVIGRATSVRKHTSLDGQKPLVCQLIGNKRQPVADPIIVLDRHGAGRGDRIIVTSDGKGLRQLLNQQRTPARWWNLGIVDE